MSDELKEKYYYIPKDVRTECTLIILFLQMITFRSQLAVCNIILVLC